MSPFIAVGLLVSAVFFLLQILPIPWQKRSEIEVVTDSVIPRIPPQDAGRIYHMLQGIDSLFAEQNITYWIGGMTLLGAVRHQGLIPWDKAAEIQVFLEDGKRIEDLYPEWEKLGLQLEEIPQGIRLISLHNPSLFIDIAYVYNESGKIKPRNTEAFWEQDEIFPLEETAFGPLHLKMPKNPMRYLIELYGNDVMENTALPKEISSTKKNNSHLPIVDFSPAPFEMPETGEPLLF